MDSALSSPGISKLTPVKTEVQTDSELKEDNEDEFYDADVKVFAESKNTSTASIEKRKQSALDNPMGFDMTHVFPCDVCDKILRTRDSLRCHVKTIHEDERHFLCEDCGRSFAQKQHLKLHTETKHFSAEEKIAW